MDNKTKKDSGPNQNTQNPAENGDIDSVDKIRDILFGNQMRDFDRKFSQLEERIASDLASLRKENSLQIESLQSYIESEVAVMDSRLGSEEKTRIQDTDQLEDELRKNIKRIDQQMTEAGSSVDKQTREINQKLLKQSQDFTAEMGQQLEQLRKRLDDFKQDLSTGKVDKSVLSEMLNTLAIQINEAD